jgi:hypothetical protein
MNVEGAVGEAFDTGKNLVGSLGPEGTDQHSDAA